MYKVKWSPFVPDCFLTCGADWTIRLWHTDLTKPVLTFVSSTKSVNDVCWSNVCATVFGAVSDNRYKPLLVVSSWGREFISGSYFEQASEGVSLTDLSDLSWSAIVINSNNSRRGYNHFDLTSNTAG